MPGIIFLLLPMSVLIVTTLAIIAFLDVAFREPEPTFAGNCAISSMTVSCLNTPATYVSSTLQGIAKWPAESNDATLYGCRSYVPPVTEPEAMAIADELRQRGNRELLKVLDRSRQAGHACPMLSEAGMCVCQMTRPIACIGRCVVGGDMPKWARGLGDTVSEALRNHLALQHENSETRPLNEALVDLLDQPRV